MYFLNAVTESDLMALAQKDTDSQTVTPTAPSEPEPAAPAEPEEPSEPETSEPEPEQPAPKRNNSMMFLAASLIGICFQKVRSQSVRRFFIKSPMLTGTVKGKQTKSGGFRLLKQFEWISITLQKIFKRSFFPYLFMRWGNSYSPVYRRLST